MEAQAWRTALDPGGRWVPHVIAAMDDRVSQLRAGGQPRCGRAGARLRPGSRPRVRQDRQGGHRREAVPDHLRRSRRRQRRSRSSRSRTPRLAVCVRMISEGVDIPRAACLAWLTSYRTPLFFAQAVGRVVRARTARARRRRSTLPAVRPLLTLAADLESERDRVVRLPARWASRTSSTRSRSEVERLTGLNEWEAIDAEASLRSRARRRPGRHGGIGGPSVPRTSTMGAFPACSPRSRRRRCWPGVTRSCTSGCGRRARRTREADLDRRRAGRTPGRCAARSTRWWRGWQRPAGCRTRSCTRRSGRRFPVRRRPRRPPTCWPAAVTTCWNGSAVAPRRPAQLLVTVTVFR